ncbi:MAG: hypothetical protein JWQ14_3038 [Adhaeribacter sp.]|nr:hypothetical protein [Adhaeribacter sp.]
MNIAFWWVKTKNEPGRNVGIFLRNKSSCILAFYNYTGWSLLDFCIGRKDKGQGLEILGKKSKFSR